MKHVTRLLTAVFCFAGAALAQLTPGTPTSQNPTTTGGGIDTSTERTEFRKAIRAETYDPTVGFYDTFEDPIRYPDGSTLTSGVSLPKVGNAWRSTTTYPHLIRNGSLQAGYSSLNYFGSNVATKNDGTFTMGFEFTIRSVPNASALRANYQNITFKNGQLISSDGSTIYPAQSIHTNISSGKIEQIGVFQNPLDVQFQGEADDDTITTSAPHDIQNGEYIQLYQGTTLPGGTVQGQYYAIYVSSTKLKLALTKAEALAGTAVNLTSDGTADNTVTLLFEPLNRKPASQTDASVMWQPNQTEVRGFQGEADNENLYLTQPILNLQTGDPVFIQGDNLPTGLINNTTYYYMPAAEGAVFDHQMRVATTRANALAGTAVNLTSDGGVNQTLSFNVSPPGGFSVSGMPLDRRGVIIVEAKGTTLTYDNVGVGKVEFYYRRLPNYIGPDMHWYWEPFGAKYGSPTQYSQFDLHAMFAESPYYREEFLRRAAGNVAQTGGGGVFTWNNSRLEIVSGFRPMGLAGVPDYNVRFAAGASSLTAKGVQQRFNGGHFYAEGGYLGEVGYANVGANVLGRASMSVATGTSYPISAPAGTTSVLHSWTSIPAMEAGDAMRYTITGQIVGSNDKNIGLWLNPYNQVFFDSNPWKSYSAATSDIITCSNHQLRTGDLVQFTTGGTQPGGISLLTDYYVIYLSKDTFSIATSETNAQNRAPVVDITSTGTSWQTVVWHPLKNQAGQYKIDVVRNVNSASQLCLQTTMQIPDGRWLPPQRYTSSLTTESHVMDMYSVVTDAGAVTIDGIQCEVLRNINN